MARFFFQVVTAFFVLASFCVRRVKISRASGTCCNFLWVWSGFDSFAELIQFVIQKHTLQITRRKVKTEQEWVKQWVCDYFSHRSYNRQRSVEWGDGDTAWVWCSKWLLHQVMRRAGANDAENQRENLFYRLLYISALYFRPSMR